MLQKRSNVLLRMKRFFFSFVFFNYPLFHIEMCKFVTQCLCVGDVHIYVRILYTLNKSTTTPNILSRFELSLLLVAW